MFKKQLIFLFVLPKFILAQYDTLTQSQIDSFAKYELNENTLEDFRKMLESNAVFSGWSKYYSGQAITLYNKGIIDSARIYADSAIQNFEQLDPKNTLDEASLMQAYSALGFVYNSMEEYALSTESFLKALEVEKKYPYKYRSYITSYIAHNHLSLGNDRKALNYYQKNLKDTIYTAIPQAHVVTLTRLGVLYSKNYLNNRDSAYYYHKKAENTSYAMGYTANLPFIYSNLGALFRESNVDSAMFYFRRSQSLYSSYDIVRNISQSNPDLDILVNNSYVDIQDKKYPSAIRNLLLAINNLRDNINNKNDRDILMNAYDHITVAYEKTGNYEKAMQYLKEKEQFLKDFHRKELKAEIEKIEVAYQTREKEEQIQQLKLENQNQELLVAKQRAQLTLGIVVAGALLLATFLYFRQKNFKTKLQKILLEQRLLRSQMNPHFMFNVLQNVTVMIGSEPKKAKQLISDFGGLLRLTLENSREDFVLLEDELTASKQYLALYSNTVKPFHYEISLATELEPNAIMVPPMLIQPLLENAIKHGIGSIKQQGKIQVVLRKKDDRFLQCEVKDNGTGFKENHLKKKSMGLRIIEERLKRYIGNTPFELLVIQDENTSSTDMTKITITIPFYHL